MRLMLMTVKGGGLLPYKRLVSVDNDLELIAQMRLVALREILRMKPDRSIHTDILRDLHVSLKDTGLTEYPETEQEVKELFRKYA